MDTKGLKERKLGALEELAKSYMDEEDTLNRIDEVVDTTPLKRDDDLDFDKKLNTQLRRQHSEDFDRELDYMWSILADNPELQKDPRIIKGLQERERNFKGYKAISEDIDEDYLKNKKKDTFRFDGEI